MTNPRQISKNVLDSTQCITMQTNTTPQGHSLHSYTLGYAQLRPFATRLPVLAATDDVTRPMETETLSAGNKSEKSEDMLTSET